jgi:hypothetical protein
MMSPVLPLAALLTACAASVALAQSAPPPVGTWQGENTGDILQVLGDGSCSASGMVNVAGTCGWSPTATGGVLTMTYAGLPELANLYYNVTWIDGNTILLNSVERFFRVQ